VRFAEKYLDVFRATHDELLDEYAPHPASLPATCPLTPVRSTIRQPEQHRHRRTATQHNAPSRSTPSNSSTSKITAFTPVILRPSFPVSYRSGGEGDQATATHSEHTHTSRSGSRASAVAGWTVHIDSLGSDGMGVGAEKGRSVAGLA